jgi:hypothetical protein
LDFDVVTNHNVVTNKYILPQGTFLANPGPTADMGEVPHSASISYLGTFINDRTWMNIASH